MPVVVALWVANAFMGGLHLDSQRFSTVIPKCIEMIEGSSIPSVPFPPLDEMIRVSATA
jgi:hypothetical protein